LNTARIYTHR